MTSTGQVWPAAQASTAALVLAALIASRRVQLPLLEMPSAVVVTKMSRARAGRATTNAVHSTATRHARTARRAPEQTDDEVRIDRPSI